MTPDTNALASPLIFAVACNYSGRECRSPSLKQWRAMHRDDYTHQPLTAGWGVMDAVGCSMSQAVPVLLCLLSPDSLPATLPSLSPFSSSLRVLILFSTYGLSSFPRFSFHHSPFYLIILLPIFSLSLPLPFRFNISIARYPFPSSSPCLPFFLSSLFTLSCIFFL